MIKLVAVEEIPDKDSPAHLISQFLESGTKTVVLDLTEESRMPQEVYAQVYNYLRRNGDIKAKIQMVSGQLYLSRID